MIYQSFRGLGVAIGLIYGLAASALPVSTLGQVPLKSSPQAGAVTLRQLSAGQGMEAIGKAPGAWIKVKVGSQMGWVRRSDISLGGSIATAPGAEPLPPAPENDENFPKPAPFQDESDEDPRAAELDNELDDELIDEGDPKDDRYIAARGGQFFQSPFAMAERYGLIEKGDEVVIVQKSSNKKWSKLRLKITGEEGWFPSAYVKLDKKDRIPRGSMHSVATEVLYANQGYNAGLALGYSMNLYPKGLAGRPSDRIEAAFLFGYFMGEKLSSGTRTLAVKYYTYSFLGRYFFLPSPGPWGVAPEAGFTYVRSQINNNGFTKEVMDAEGLGSGTSGLRLNLGVRGTYSFSPQILAYAGLRTLISSSFYAWICGGAEYRF